VAVPHHVVLRLPVERERSLGVDRQREPGSHVVETPDNSVHQECDQCKLQIWTWHTHIFCHQLRAFIRIRVVHSCDALMRCNCQDLYKPV
jgi:hypothetical protein